MENSKLNIDVIHLIMAFSDTKDIVSIMNTCHMLDREGVRHLLRDEVTLKNQEQVVSFLAFFMGRKGPADTLRRRLHFLTHLSLQVLCQHELLQGLACALVQFFDKLVPLATNFVSLAIYPAEELLAVHPPLVSAIASLTTLKKLDLDFAGEHCAAMLREFQSELLNVNVIFGDNFVMPTADRNPMLLLHGSQATLRQLSTNGSMSSSDGPCYPNVVKLHLIDAELPVTQYYARAYPNISFLAMSGCNEYDDDDEVWLGHRETNIARQAQYGTWSSLRHYSGSVLGLWLLGLTCRVHRLELNFGDQDVDTYMLADVLLDTRPSDVSLTLPNASCFTYEEVLSIFCWEWTVYVKTLKLEICFNDYDDRGLDVQALLNDCMAYILELSNISVFEMTLDLTWLDETVADVALHPIEQHLRDMDMKAYADNLLMTARSLKEVDITVCGHTFFRRTIMHRRRGAEVTPTQDKSITTPMD